MLRFILLVLLFFTFSILPVAYAVGKKKVKNAAYAVGKKKVKNAACAVGKKKVKNAACAVGKKRITKKLKQKQIITSQFKKEDFVPSLSDTLNSTNKLKSKIKRQLAKEWNVDSSGVAAKRNSKSQTKGYNGGDSIDEMARFGDFAVGISERGEEELKKVKKK